ncbi:CNH domain containing protein [Lactarius tabidus]
MVFEDSDSMFTGEVTCSVPFTTTDGRALVAVGCAEGVWIGFRHNPRSMRRVLHLKVVTQCVVLEDFGIFLVLADKSLFAYDIEELVSTSPQRANTTPTPQKLNISNDVLFCRAGNFNGRTFVIYMKKKGSDSVFRVLAPVVDKITKNAKAPVFLSSRFGLRPPRSEWFRTYRDFLLPTEEHDPPELIVSIVLYLSLHDITSFQRTCRKLCDVCNDITLRYLVQMERSGVSDDLRPGLSYAERLLVLQRREEAWANLDFRKTVKVTVPFESTIIYNFTGGAVLLGTRLHITSRGSTIGFSYVTLPSLTSTEDQKLEWRGLTLGIQILNVGLAVHEHDLIAALTAKRDKNGPNDRYYTLEIRLFSFSTGQPHPLAEQPIIFIGSILLPDRPHLWTEIVGDYLALRITSPLAQNPSLEMFFLVRWKKGEAHCLRSCECGASAYFSFLTEDTLVIPDPLQNNLEIVRIVVDESDDDIPRLVPLCTLNLPPLAEHASIIALGCCARPNPTGSGSGPLLVPAPSSRPFRDTAADAIVHFQLVIKDMNPHAAHFSRETRRFTFIVHRRALVAHIPRAHLACAPFRSVPGAAPTVVPWDAWGVPVTRWFDSDPASMRSITDVAGQRAATMEDTMEDDTPTPIIVRDFNPHAVRAALAREKSRVLPNGNRQAVKMEEDVIPAGSMFREDVRSALPYIETVTQTRYGYEGVLIDEERILGLETSKGDKVVISSFNVHVLG